MKREQGDVTTYLCLLSTPPSTSASTTIRTHTLTHTHTQDYIRKKNKWLVKIHEWVQAHGGDPIIPFSGAYENEVRGCRTAAGCLFVVTRKAD